MKLAAPAVLDRLLSERRASAVSAKDLRLAGDLPWPEQENSVFGLQG